MIEKRQKKLPTSYCSYVDVFHGSLARNMPEFEGIAAKWFFIKAQTGNTHPGASLPFSAPSACAYTGGYPNGYTPYWYNSYAKPERIIEEGTPEAVGFSHFHPSGTGAIGTYYNYFIITPFEGEVIPDRYTRFKLADEYGIPGYYSCNFGHVAVEVTVSHMAAVYRIRFTDAAGSILFDPKLNGLFRDGKSEAAYGEVIASEILSGHLALSIQYECRLHVWLGIPDGCIISETVDGRFLMKCDKEEVELTVGFSFNSLENAKYNKEQAEVSGFDRLCSQADKTWNRYLQAINVEAGEKDKSLFYTCLYRCLLKPCDITGDSPFWNDQKCFVDFATLWDQYKTQLPLIFTLYPGKASDIINSLLAAAEKFGYFPIDILLKKQDATSEMQARALAWYSIYDAYVRGIKGVDYHRALCLIEEDLLGVRNKDFVRNGITAPYVTHTLDLAGGCYAAMQIANVLGEEKKAEQFGKYYKNWENVFLKEKNDLLPESSTYYEGTNWNYSFRLLPEMKKRIFDRECFLKDLDAFFGYGKDDVEQLEDVSQTELLKSGEQLGRFEGFNNETDMETPYAYIYAGEPNKCDEICRMGMRYTVSHGRGGLCGNDDSGGLTSMIVWNMLGLFPVTGTNDILIGSPCFEKTVVHLPDTKELCIECENFSLDNIYVETARFNGKCVNDRIISVNELMQGGKLSLQMSNIKRILQG